ncbi:MAG TPA: FAD-binding oxidoreductase [Candidatus Saccharimonadales bacterium]|nr:FAD-binding oxidoreductase [Candidatus Saccharimonadales bacterium]
MSLWSPAGQPVRRTAPLAEDYRETPLWWDDTTFPSVAESALPDTADVVVIGAGFTGLAAAARLGSLGKHAVLLDSGGLGEGASGRNAGMIHAGVRRSVTFLERKHGGAGRALHDAGVEAYGFVARTAAAAAPDAMYTQSGWLHLAHRKSRMHGLRKDEAERRQRLGESTVMLEGAALESEAPCRGYFGGMLTDNGASIHPARYLAGLARLSLANGAALHLQTRVTAIEPLQAGALVHTSRGDVTAGEVLVATNGYTDGAAPWARRRIIPIGSYIIATEPLGDARATEISPQRRMMSDSRNFLHYWRLSPDGRLVFGGRTSFAPVSVQSARDRLYAAMIDAYPQLAGVRVSHAWTGNVGFTLDQLPHLTRSDGITYAMGYCGSGVALGSWMGTLAAEWIARGARPAFSGLRFPRIPLYRGHPWFLPLVGVYYSLLDRL